jgi:amino acid transporter
MSQQTSLKRALSFPLLTVYGLGTMVGGGFYALLGEVAGLAGLHAPVSFIAAAFVALFSALSFGELAARFPYSAGESRYVLEAFGRRWLSVTVGWLVIATGVVSAATLANAFSGFLQDLVIVPRAPTIALLVVGLGAVAIWGISESVVLVVAITCIEVGGLLYVLVVAGGSLAELPRQLPDMLPPLSPAPWSGIMLGGFLAFYAFIGFEDMVNLAEEVKRPRRTLPRAILTALGLTTLLYVCVATVAVLAVAPAELAQSNTPLARVLGLEAGRSMVAIVVISMLAGVNGALVQLVMASRVAYGMAAKGMGPTFLSRIHPHTRTPVYATSIIIVVTLLLALWFPLVTLARTTSAIILAIFAIVNLALLVLKRQGVPTDPDVPSHPMWVPAVGVVLSVGFLLYQGVATAAHLVDH